MSEVHTVVNKLNTLNIDNLQKKFVELFGEGRINERVIRASAPGRVNLIGEHTDYHFGFVLPVAINLRTFVVARKRDDNIIKICSINLNKTVVRNINELIPDKKDWSSYVLGPFYILRKSGFDINGVEMLIYGEVPFGGGLSSSASVQVAVLESLVGLYNIRIDNLEKAKLARQAENEFVAVPCGIMDQMASVFGEKNCALLIDCKTLQVEKIRIPSNWKIVVCDSGIRHSLASSEYSKRQEECKIAVDAIKKNHPEVASLREAKSEYLEEVKDKIPETSYRRCAYVLAENKRVLEAKNALSEGKEQMIKRLFYDSHCGLKNDYEVTCEEIDILVSIAQDLDGCIGARMTGGGFGGNIVCLVKDSFTEKFVRDIKQKYKNYVGKDTEVRILESDSGSGSQIIQIK